MNYKEIEWTIIFYLPSNTELFDTAIITKTGEIKKVYNFSDSLSTCMVWTDKNIAKQFAIEYAGKYRWKLFPTKIEIIEFDK